MPSRTTGTTLQLLIQVDGLSRPTLDRAIAAGAVPNIAALARGPGMALGSMYSGLPSTTPAVQGELFYGCPAAVPAFAYLEKGVKPRQLMDPASASAVQLRLEAQGEPLLADGSSYCNIYTGGARIARFSPAGMGQPRRALRRGPLLQARSATVYGVVALRFLVMMGGEAARMLIASDRGGLKRVPARLRSAQDRIVTSVLLRDVARLEARHDIAAGLPVVHVNFLGYDKMAHRYGPDSPPARRALKGLDGATGTLLRALRTHGAPQATVVVYSDHGQEATTPFTTGHSGAIERLVDEAAQAVLPHAEPTPADTEGGARHSALEQAGERLLGVGSTRDGTPRVAHTVQSGPIAHIYLPEGVDARQRRTIGCAVARSVPGVVVLWREEGPMGCIGTSPPRALDAICRDHLDGHPFGDRIAPDLARVLEHPDAGALILLGTGLVREARSFADEHGSHGGPGPIETHAFVIAPERLGLHGRTREPGIADLRAAILDDRRRHA